MCNGCLVGLPLDGLGADVSGLWVFPLARGSGFADGCAAGAEGASGSITPMLAAPSLPEQLAAAGFAGLAASCLPADTPLAALHILVDATAGDPGFTLPHLAHLAAVQGERMLRSFVAASAAACYAHHWRLAARQLVPSEELHAAGAQAALLTVEPVGWEPLLHGLRVLLPGAAGACAPLETRCVDVTAALATSFARMLREDTARLVAWFCDAGPTALVELSLQQRVLRRTHELLSDYMQLPCWQDLWADANAAVAGRGERPDANGREGAAPPSRGLVGDAAVQGVARMLSGALYDTQRQVLLAPAGEPGDGSAAPVAWDGGSLGSDEVGAALAALAAPWFGVFGQPHLGALLELEGDWALQALLEAALGVFEAQQPPLSEALCQLQAQLPAWPRVQPSPSGGGGAGAVFRVYADALRLGGAEGPCSPAATALRRLQVAGNALALLTMVGAAAGAALPGRFAQAAPMLGITAVATGGCCAPGATEGGPAPGLRAPPFEEGTPSHFQSMLLGASATLVTESQLLVVQSCELQAWRATRGVDVMPRCLERVSACLARLQAEVEGAAAAQAAGTIGPAAASASPLPARSPTRRAAQCTQPAALVLPGPAAVEAAACSPSRPPASPFAAPAAQQAALIGCDAPNAGGVGLPLTAGSMAAGGSAAGEPERSPPPAAEGSGLTPPVSGRSLCGDTVLDGSGDTAGEGASGDAGTAHGVTVWYVNQHAVQGSGALPGEASDNIADAAARHVDLGPIASPSPGPPHGAEWAGAGEHVGADGATPHPRTSPPMGMDNSPLAEMYDETVTTLLEVMADRDAKTRRIQELECEVHMKTEQLTMLLHGPIRSPGQSEGGAASGVLSCVEDGSDASGSRGTAAAAAAADVTAAAALPAGQSSPAGMAPRAMSGRVHLPSRLVQSGGLEAFAAGSADARARGQAASGDSIGSGGSSPAQDDQPARSITKLLAEGDDSTWSGGGVSAGGASLDGARSERRPDSPPRRPRETTLPRLVPAAGPGLALPTALSALRFLLLHQATTAAGDGDEGEGRCPPPPYGDGPLWAAAVAIELLGLSRAFRRVDMLGNLAHWTRYDAAAAAGREAEVAAEEAELAEAEDAAAAEDGGMERAVNAARAARAAARADADAAATLVGTSSTPARVWEAAALAVTARGASGGPAGAGRLRFAGLAPGGGEEVVDAAQDADPLARLPACRAPLLFSAAPGRFSAAAAGAARARAAAARRPGGAPAKAGLIESSRAARAVARFLEVAPPSAYSQSVRGARSEAVSNIGSSAASDIIRSNDRFALPPGLLAGDLRPSDCDQAGAGSSVAAALASKLAAGAARRGGAAAVGDGGGSVPLAGRGSDVGGAGSIGGIGRALLGRLPTMRRNA